MKKTNLELLDVKLDLLSCKGNKIEAPEIKVQSLISAMSSSLSFREIDERMNNIKQYISPTFLEFCQPKSESHCQ